MKIFLFILLIVFALGLVLASSGGLVQAAPSAKDQFNSSLKETGIESGHTTDRKGAGTPYFQNLDFVEFIGRIIQMLLALIGIIFLFLMIYGGYKWMMSRGNESEVAAAQNTIKNAIIGLILILAAYIITALITGLLDPWGMNYVEIPPEA